MISFALWQRSNSSSRRANSIVQVRRPTCERATSALTGSRRQSHPKRLRLSNPMTWQTTALYRQAARPHHRRMATAIAGAPGSRRKVRVRIATAESELEPLQFAAGTRPPSPFGSMALASILPAGPNCGPTCTPSRWKSRTSPSRPYGATAMLCRRSPLHRSNRPAEACTRFKLKCNEPRQ
jgi:hypothetical protein